MFLKFWYNVTNHNIRSKSQLLNPYLYKSVWNMHTFSHNIFSDFPQANGLSIRHTNKEQTFFCILCMMAMGTATLFLWCHQVVCFIFSWRHVYIWRYTQTFLCSNFCKPTQTKQFILLLGGFPSAQYYQGQEADN